MDGITENADKLQVGQMAARVGMVSLVYSKGFRFSNFKEKDVG
jgi:hypothetical protein